MHVRRLLIVLVVIAFVAAACGRSDDESDTATETPSTPAPEAEGDGEGEGEGAPDGEGEGEADGEGAIEEAAPLALAEGGFGDLGAVCSAGEAAPTPIEGVTGIDGTTIRVATFADPGFAGRPGLNQEFFDTAEAVVEWCNANGGVRGYDLSVDLRDAALTDYAPRIVESCDDNFFMVGGGAVFDDTGQADRLGCGLPDIAGFVVTGTAAEADLVHQPVPNPVQSLPIGDFLWLGEQFPEATSKIGVFTGSLPTTVTVAERYKEAIADLGWTVVYDQQYDPAGEANWTPFAQAIADAGVEGLIWIGEPANLAELRQAMSVIDYEPAFVRTDANHYDESYIVLGGDTVGDTFVRSAFWPFERADDNKAVSDYFELMETYRPNGKFPALLGAQGLSAWMLFLASLGDCIDAGDVSRDCVYATAGEQTSWAGGGLHAPQNVQDRSATDCFVVAEATADGFVFPDVTGFGSTDIDDFYTCDASFSVVLTGEYGEGALCPSGVENPLPSEC